MNERVMKRTVIITTILIVVACLIAAWRARPLYAEGPLALYDCVRGLEDGGGYVEVCRVYDPETKRHFIVSTVRTIHGAGIAIVGEALASTY